MGTYSVRLAVVGLMLAVAAGCGGGGGGGSTPGLVPETRPFDFTVSVSGTSDPLVNPQFFQDPGLNTPGVELRSSSGNLVATASASVTGQQTTDPVEAGFTLAINLDASGSMATNDPNGFRFTASDALIDAVGDTTGGTDTRIFTHRDRGSDGYATSAKLIANFQANTTAGSDAARAAAIQAAQAEGASGGSPALSSTRNIIDGLPTAAPQHALLLLTDGLNKDEDPAAVDPTPCSNPADSGCSNDTATVVASAAANNTRIFVAGLGNNDDALQRFEDLATQTGGVFVKASQAGQLEGQFGSLGALLSGGGVVVNGTTSAVPIVTGGNPIITGFLSFEKPAAGCPVSSTEVAGNRCRVQFP